MLNFIRYIGYSIGAITIRKAWNWLIEDVDPDPGTKEFAKEYRKIYGKYKCSKKFFCISFICGFRWSDASY